DELTFRHLRILHTLYAMLSSYPPPPIYTYTTLFQALRNLHLLGAIAARPRRERHTDRVADPLLQQDREAGGARDDALGPHPGLGDRKSTRLNSSHEWVSYAVCCLKNNV